MKKEQWRALQDRRLGTLARSFAPRALTKPPRVSHKVTLRPNRMKGLEEQGLFHITYIKNLYVCCRRPHRKVGTGTEEQDGTYILHDGRLR